MPSHLYNYTDNSLAICLITAAIVFALAWLFNGYKLGKFKKFRHTAPQDSVARTPRRKWGLLLVVLALTVLIAMLALLLASS